MDINFCDKSQIYILIVNYIDNFQGIPEEVRNAFTKAGLTDEEIMSQPEKVQEILKDLALDEIIRSGIKN